MDTKGELMDKFKFVMSSAWTFLKPFIKVLLSEIGPIIIQIALEAVKSAAASGMANDTKRSYAFNKISEGLSAKGLKVSDSVINTSLEVAVQKIKE